MTHILKPFMQAVDCLFLPFTHAVSDKTRHLHVGPYKNHPVNILPATHLAYLLDYSPFLKELNLVVTGKDISIDVAGCPLYAAAFPSDCHIVRLGDCNDGQAITAMADFDNRKPLKIILAEFKTQGTLAQHLIETEEEFGIDLVTDTVPKKTNPAPAPR